MGPDHIETSVSLNNLALVYQAQGNYEAAEPLFVRALKTEEKAVGPDHTDTLMGVNNLALLYQAKGDYAAAEPLLQRALKTRERVLGLDHPLTAASMDSLAFHYRVLGKYAAAEPLYQQALKIWEKKPWYRSHRKFHALDNMATLYWNVRPSGSRAILCKPWFGDST